MAQVLTARLFSSEQELDEVKQKVFATELYKSGWTTLVNGLKLSVPQQQQWVRQSFNTDGFQTPELRRFTDMVVRPALAVSINTVPAELAGIMHRYLAILTGSESSEQDAASIRVACAALNGELNDHPLVLGLAVRKLNLCFTYNHFCLVLQISLSCTNEHILKHLLLASTYQVFSLGGLLGFHHPGLCLQARKVIDKQRRGIFNLRGRKANETDREASLIADAALTLALHSANMSLAREFGLAASHCRINIDKLRDESLPCGPLALHWESTMKTNWLLADQRYPKAPESPRCVLTLVNP